MEYEQEFERDFMRRTLELLKQYSGPFDATLLLNCLLGLLIVPRETSLDKIPLDPVEKLSEWGISPSSIRNFGRASASGTLRGLVRSLRNAVAHFNFRPLHRDGNVTGFAFSDRSGFDAAISLPEVKEFVQRLSSHLEAKLAA